MADTSKLSVPISTARRISVIAEESDSGVQDVELSPQEIKVRISKKIFIEHFSFSPTIVHLFRLGIFPSR